MEIQILSFIPSTTYFNICCVILTPPEEFNAKNPADLPAGKWKSHRHPQLTHRSSESTGEDMSALITASKPLSGFLTHTHTHTLTGPPGLPLLWRVQDRRRLVVPGRAAAEEDIMILQRECHCWVQRGGRGGRGFVADHWLSSGLLRMEGWKRKMGVGGRKKEEHYLPVHSRNWTCGRLMRERRERREIEPPQKCESGKRRVEESWKGGVHILHLWHHSLPSAPFPLFLPAAKEHLQDSPSYPDQENTQTPSHIYFWGSFSLLTSESRYYLSYPVYCYEATSRSRLAQLCLKTGNRRKTAHPAAVFKVEKICLLAV